MNAPALLDLSHLTSKPIEDGDAGIILRQDGSFNIFSTGDIDGDNMSDEQQVQATKMMALCVALSIPQVMDILITMSEDPNVVGDGIEIGMVN